MNDDINLGEALGAVFGQPTELAPGITAYGLKPILPLPAKVSPELMAKAIEVADDAHRGVFRKHSRVPYITHPEAVAKALSSDHLKVLAWLHDVMEDNPVYTEARMRELFPAWVVDHLLLLTRKPDEPYDNFIVRAALNPATKAVKIADIRHNLTDLKPGSLRDKYRLALRFLGEEP